MSDRGVDHTCMPSRLSLAGVNVRFQRKFPMAFLILQENRAVSPLLTQRHTLLLLEGM